MGYSVSMKNETPEFVTPDISENYPSRGKRLGPAWAMLWSTLMSGNRDEYVNGRELAKKVAEVFKLHPDTVANLLPRAHLAGLLEREMGDFVSTRGVRKRAFYRVAEKYRT